MLQGRKKMNLDGGLRDRSRIHKRGVLDMVAVGVLRCTILEHEAPC